MPTTENIEEARTSLARVQEFDPASTARREALGASLSFEEAVPDATRLVNLFQRINPHSLSTMSDGMCQQIKNLADGTYAILERILQFNPSTASNAGEERRNLIQELRNHAESVTNQLAPLITFSVVASLDFSSTQQEFRIALQRFEDDRAKALDEVEKLKVQADETLERVRAAAANKGFRNKLTISTRSRRTTRRRRVSG